MNHTILDSTDPQVAEVLNLELARQRDSIELIASENFTSIAVMEAMGSVLTNKYAEGYPGKRYYGGCERVDMVENLARDRAGRRRTPPRPPRRPRARAAAALRRLVRRAAARRALDLVERAGRPRPRS